MTFLRNDTAAFKSRNIQTVRYEIGTPICRSWDIEQYYIKNEGAKRQKCPKMPEKYSCKLCRTYVQFLFAPKHDLFVGLAVGLPDTLSILEINLGNTDK